MNVRSLIIPQVPEAQLIFFFRSIIYYSDWIISIVLSSTSLILSSVPFLDVIHPLSILLDF